MTAVSMISLNALGAAVLLLLPIVVSSVAAQYRLSDWDTALIAAADMLGASLSSFLISFVLGRWPWRNLLAVAVFILAATDAFSAQTISIEVLVSARFIGGLAEGTLLAVSAASIGSSVAPDRMFALATAGQLGVGAVALFASPWILMALGPKGLFGALSVITIASLALVPFMPNDAWSFTERVVLKNNASIPASAFAGLAAIFIYFIAQGSVWAYLGQIGTANGLSTNAVATALAVSSVGGLIGAMLAAWLNLRFGRLAPLVLGTTCTSSSMVLLCTNFGLPLYLASVIAFNLAWNFSVPYQFGILAKLDPSQRAVALGQTVIFAGLSVGPMIVGGLVHSRQIATVGEFCVVLCILSLATFSALLRRKLPRQVPA